MNTLISFKVKPAKYNSSLSIYFSSVFNIEHSMPSGDWRGVFIHDKFLKGQMYFILRMIRHDVQNLLNFLHRV